MGTQLVLSFAKRLFFNLCNALNSKPNSQTIRILSPYRNISLFSLVFILDIAQSRPLDTVANMAIILLKQEDYLLHKLLSTLSEQFLDEGGFKERMHRMRVERRGR